ncbi:hypothetical protein NQ317_006339 [Molorchus minor]|uniref:Uncharacterized protein n=1 Tax=Molorchus minor TaxID=1323400 RepID=A0ABQ9JDJ3_9CUCU|nr:hypothetical protein NQ317_006339 [Molorchus minor]
MSNRWQVRPIIEKGHAIGGAAGCHTQCNIYCLATGLADDNATDMAFPDDFLFGAATAAYQVEDGKGESVWDYVVHNFPERVEDGTTADVTCDSYHKYKEDVAMLKELGVNFYRFSIAWTRIMPNGTADYINEAGVSYYRNLIKELKDNGIESMITLYHWDLPQQLADIGGWLEDSMIDIYAEYARTCFQLFGDDVKFWTTFNEIKEFCQLGYGEGGLPPLHYEPGIGEYKCTRVVLKAHAKAYRIYDEEFRATQNGMIGAIFDTHWFEPRTNSSEDVAAAEQGRQFSFGWFANPIVNGDYPEIMKTRIADRSAKEGFNQSRLPEFTEDEIGVHQRYLRLYRSQHCIEEPEIGDPSYSKDMAVSQYQSPDWEGSSISWLKVVPWGIRGLLNWVRETYNDPYVIVTENGYADDGVLDDDMRIHYYQSYISNVRLAMDDGVKVLAYTAWSLMDNYEWLNGYTKKFGLYNVDFNDPNRTWTPKKSMEYYKKVIATHCVIDNCTR